MRDLEMSTGTGGAAAVLLSVAEIGRWSRRLSVAGAGTTDAERIDLIRALEELKAAAEGAQAEVTAAFDRSQRAEAAARGVPEARRGRGIAAQVAWARRESPHRGERHVGLAKVARAELPCAYQALRAGQVSEWRVTLLARETACLSREHRMLVDGAVAGDAERFARMGDRELVGAVSELACRLDAAAVAKRRRSAEADRHTTLRPAPDVMTWFGALLPVRDGVAVHAALLEEASRRRCAGDPRPRGALMADVLVERVLAPHLADTGPAQLPLHIHVVVPDSVLLGDSDGGGHVDGFGPVPGDLVREWLAAHAERGVQDWVSRLYQRPSTRELVAMDSRGRRFDGRLAEFLRLRDRVCRTPWCDAPVRHLDHAEDHLGGGATSARNGQGLCEACNHAKQADGWSARPVDGPRHTIEVITPTGHRYRTTAPSHGPPLWMELYPQAQPVA